MLNWIVWNRTDYLYKKIDLALNNLQRLICHKTQPTQQATKHILLKTFLNEPKRILFQTVKWLQVLLCIPNSSFKHHSYFL